MVTHSRIDTLTDCSVDKITIRSMVIQHVSTLNCPSIPLPSPRYGELDGFDTASVHWIIGRRTRRSLHPPPGGLCNTATKSTLLPDNPP